MIQQKWQRKAAHRGNNCFQLKVEIIFVFHKQKFFKDVYNLNNKIFKVLKNLFKDVLYSETKLDLV